MSGFRGGPGNLRVGRKQLTRLFVAQNGPFGAPFLTPKFPRKSLCGSFFRRLRKGGWQEGVGDKQTPKKNPKSSPEMCPHSPKGAQEKGDRKEPQSLAFQGFLRANPFCPPTPFPKLLIFAFLSQEVRHTNFFWGSKMGHFWVGGAKSFVLKKFTCVSVP